MNVPQGATKTYGRYHVVGVLARGGMGTVYLARSIGLAGFSRTVALKVLHPHFAEEPQVVAMFLAEARLAARIAHKNVVDVLDVDLIGGEHVIAMRYVEGGSLGGLVKAQRPEKLPVGIALRIVHDALLGLHAAHEATSETGEPLGIVHRDVSPPNILVDLDGLSQITDFGVARAHGDALSSEGSLKGKLRYLAPEQLAGSELDRRVDVFAAGIVLWELLAGRSLFGSATDALIMRNVATMPIEPPQGPSAAIDQVCLRALERDPSRRFASAQDFAQALADAASTMMADREGVASLARMVFHGSSERHRAALADEARAPRSVPPPPSVPPDPTAPLATGATPPSRATPWSPMRIGLVAAALLTIAAVLIARWVLATRAIASEELVPVPVAVAATAEPAAATSEPEPAAAASASAAASGTRPKPARGNARGNPVRRPGTANSATGPYVPNGL